MPTSCAFDATLLERLPTVLAVPLHQFAAATEAEQRLHRLCDAAEVIGRFCTVLGVAEARLPGERHQLPERLVKVLGPTIQTPTFARWLSMARDLADFLSADRALPLALPELPRFIRDVLLKTAPPGNRYLDGSLLELRNTLAHGGAMSAAMADYLLRGDPTGLPRGLPSSVPAEADAEAEEVAAEAEPPLDTTRFAGWEAVLADVVKDLADLLDGSRLGSFDGEAARLLAGVEPSGEVVPLSADLRLALRELKLQGHVLLLRDGRWLDLWPLCDHGKARLSSLRGLLESESEAPLLYYRGEPQRLLYAAFGATPPVSERGDAVADFEALFRPTPRKETAPEIALDFTEELRRDSLQLVGRAAELKHVKEILGRTTSGVLWLSGTGGIGKSFLTARVAVNHGNDLTRWCCIPWRFRVSDTDRSNPNTFLRHAITRLARWPVLGRGDVRPDLDSNKLPAQLDELLRAGGQLQPAGKDQKPPRVLFVLDGLDEAARLSPDLLEWPFRFAYPNVVWLCSGRPDRATDKAFAAERCTHLFPGGLPAMSTGDVRALLYQELGEQKYELLGLDRRDAAGNLTNALVEAIVAKSEGLPLYVRFLVEDLLTGHFELTGRLKSKLPQGLSAYYEDLLERSGIDDVQGMLPNLLGAVVWAQGPVAEELLFELLRRLDQVSPREEERLRADIRQGLQRVASMVRLAALPEGGLGYEPYHTTFRDHFRGSTARLGRTNNRAREAFVRLTKDWRNVREAAARRYVFRHGPQHLLDEHCDDDLYALARDEAVLRAQVEELPGEPEAPLRTLQAALTAAGRRDDAAGMAEFLLRHAQQTHALRNESPLTALRHGNLDRALRLADLAAPERALAYHLLLAWKLCESGRTEAARYVLDQLTRRQLPRLNEHFSETVAAILAPISKFCPAAVMELASRLLGDSGSVQLVALLLSQGLLALARSLMGLIPEVDKRANVLGEIAVAQANAGETEAAHLSLDQALQAAQSLIAPDKQVAALAGIAAAQARAGQVEEGLRTARAIGGPDSQARALVPIAELQAKAGNVEAALQTARAINDPKSQARALARIAIIQAQVGKTEAALQTTGAINDPGWRDEALTAVAAAQARAGQVEVALQTARSLDRYYQARALKAIAMVQAEAGLAEAALQTASAIDLLSQWPGALGAIAAALARAGQAETAKVTLEQALQNTDAINDSYFRVEALVAIAAAHAQAGLAQATLPTAGAIGENDFYRLWEALQPIAVEQVRAGEAEAARLTFAQILQAGNSCDDFSFRARALQAIAVRQARTGQAEAAHLSFEGAVQAAGAINDSRSRTRLLAEIAEEQAQAGLEEAARRTFERAHQEADAIHPHDRPEALGNIAAAQVRAGHGETARLTFEQAIEEARVCYDSERRASTVLGIMAAAQAQAGQAEAARRTFEQAVQTAHAIENSFTRGEALASIAQAQAWAGQAEAALQVTCGINSSSLQPWALRSVVAGLASAGQVEAALQAAGAIDGAFWRAEALRAVAHAQAQGGQVESALRTARAIDERDGRIRALQAIAASCLDTDQVEAARSILNELLAGATGGTSEAERASVLQMIACTQVKAHQSEQAIATARLILVDREEHLPAIVERFLQANDRTAFKELLISCAAHRQSAWAVCGMLAGAYPEQANAIVEVAVLFGRARG
jgi:hypothetical protein